MDSKTLIKHKNPFFSPVNQLSEGLDFSDDKVEVYELRDFVKEGPSGEADDFVVEKKSVLVDSYHLNKVIAERCKGCDLKSIVARVQATGDLSLLNQRQVVYGDGYTMPANMSDALQKGVETSEYIDSLSDEEKKKLISLSKLNQEGFEKYIQGLVDEKLAAAKAKEANAEKGGSENV